MNETQTDFIYLLSCSINEITPNKDRVIKMDLDKIYKLSNFHSLTAAIGIAIERAGITNEKFHKAYQKAIAKNLMFYQERMAIFEHFEKQGIWYMPMKGIILKDLYPRNGMREMADNDILFDSSKQKSVRDIMISLGYKVIMYDSSHDDTYHKQPIFNFEMHTSLFSSNHSRYLYEYYKNPKRLLIKDKNNNYGYHFSDEDFYVYMTAHEYKHYSVKGTGIRSLLDCYIFEKTKSTTLDRKYIESQLNLLNISYFERVRRKLAMKVFSTDTLPELNSEEMDMLMFYLSVGTYGLIENEINYALKTQSKFSFWLHKIFMTPKDMVVCHPFTQKSILLYPVGFVWHFIRALTLRRKKFIKTIKAVNKYGK